MNNLFFFPYTKDKTKFIHCDVWGHAWILNCPSNLVWSQQTQTCIEDTHSSPNPCTQDKLDQGITMFPLQDPHKYIHCDNGLNPWVQSCVAGTVFDYASQNCVWQSNSILGWLTKMIVVHDASILKTLKNMICTECACFRINFYESTKHK